MRQGKNAIGLLVSILFLSVGIVYAGHIYDGYRKGKQEYRAIEEEYTLKETAPSSTVTEEEKPAHPRKKEEEMAEKEVWRPLVAKLPADAPDKISVDWEGLQSRNEDIVAWILVPAVEISYPVMQADDNEYYLHRDIDRNYLFAGSVFMDAFNSPSLFNYNTIIYGHNMRDGSMFARLKEFQQKETLDKCRYFWLLTPKADLLYEICSIHNAQTGSDTFTVRFEDFISYQTWQEKMLQMSSPSTGASLDTQDRIVTLSTCTESSAIRMTVQGKLVWKSENNI